MYLLESIYPFGLASANLAMGWLLYNFSEPVFGGLLIMTGVFVILTAIGTAVSEHHPAFGEFT
jgi:hypothetical protein